MAFDQYNLRPVSLDTLYNLLPHVVRANDPRAAIRSYMEAMAEQHNFYLEKLKQLPALQDPSKAATFTPADFDESQEDFERYNELAALSRPLTTEEQDELVLIRSRIPRSIEAGAFEKVILSLLGDTVGADLHGRYDAKANRELIKSAIYRHHIKGTHGAVYVLGRILGFLDLKVRELWTRFTIKDPAHPASPVNDGDFAESPEEYPYWPRNPNNTYDGVTTLAIDRTDEPLINSGTPSYNLDEVFQQPPPSANYNPLVLNDGPADTRIFSQLTVELGTAGFWTAAVNDRQAFGNFTADIVARPILGTYYMEGGDFLARAKAEIPLSGGGTVIFEAPASGDWANGTSLAITVDEGGTQRLTITGFQSKIKFKSSYFDLTLATDILIFPTLFAPVLVAPNDSASLEDLTVTGTSSKSITAVSTSYADYPLLTLSNTTNLTLNSIVQINGIPSLNGRRTILEVTETGVVIGPYPGPMRTVAVAGLAPGPGLEVALELTSAADFQIGETVVVNGFGVYEVVGTDLATTITIRNNGEASNAPATTAIPVGTHVNGASDALAYASDIEVGATLVYGRLAGALPVMGSTNGTQVIAPTSQKVLNFEVYLELIATLRDLFEHIRPLTRTVRRELFGFLLRDTMPYAPSRSLDEVVLQAPNGAFWRLSVDDSNVISWTVDTTPGLVPTVVKQVDNILRLPYSWGIDDLGGFVATPVSLTTGALETQIVYLREDLFTGFVFLENGRLLASSTSPEAAVSSIHGDGTTDESGYLADDKPKVYEDLSVLTGILSSDAIVADLPGNKPDPKFIFQTAPEDDLTVIRVATESIRTFWHANFKELDDVDFKDETQAWTYKLDGSFHGKDIRLRATGGSPAIVEPLPTGDLGRQDGLFYNYPVLYLDYSGHYVWRDRETNVCIDSYYTYDSPGVSVGGTRHDISLASNDGQIEGAWALNEPSPLQISSQGFGPTPNGQVFVDKALDHPWQASATLTIALPSASFDATADPGTGACDLILESVGGLVPGMDVQITNSGSLDGFHHVVATPTSKARIPVAYASDAGDLWLAVWLQLWSLSDVKVTITPASTNLSTDTVDFEVYTDAVLLDSGALAYDESHTLTILEADTGVFAKIKALLKGSGTWTITLQALNTDPHLVNTDGFTKGLLLWGGGDRDSLEVTVLGAAEHFGDFGDDVAEFATINGVPSYRGGAWKGPSGYTITDRGLLGLPHILVRDDGSFPAPDAGLSGLLTVDTTAFTADSTAITADAVTF